MQCPAEEDMVGVGSGKMSLAIWRHELRCLKEWYQEAPILVLDYLQFCFCFAWWGMWEFEW